MGFMLGIALGLVAGIGLCVAILFQKSSDVKKRSHKLDLDFQRLKSQAAQQSQMETHQAERLRGIEATEREFREEIAAKHLQMESHQAERHRKLKEAEHKFQANLTQRLQRLETSEREFQGKKVSYESLNGENYELKQDLFNLTIRIKKSELDSLTLEEQQEEIDVLVRKLASKYLKENRAWIGSKLTPSNFSTSKQRLQKTIAACRKIGFDIPEEEEQSLIAELQEEFKRVVRLDYERQEQARIKAQIREEQRLEREVNKLIEEADRWRNSLSTEERDTFRFVHISTDEVYGSLESGSAKPFGETSPLNPNSPYAATKAAADHLVRAWFKTYGLPTITVNCTNNYGPYQFPEKLIPMIILAALEGKAIPIYGQGENLREWIYVEDFAQAIFQLSQKGVPGETYNIGSGEVIPNIEIAHKVCDIMDKLESKSEYLPHRDLIEFVEDRPGHDFCYAINSTKARNLLSWQPKISLDDGLQRTVSWYLANQNWWAPLREKKYSGARLGQLPSAKLVQ